MKEDLRSGISRRRFIKTAATGLAAGTLAARSLPSALAGGADVRAKVVSVYSPAALPGSNPDGKVTAAMLEKGASRFGGGSADDFWKGLFGADDVVGIKLNCISRAVKPNRQLIDAVAEQLRKAGVAENNIILWDRFEDQLARRARLKLNRSSEGVRVYGTERKGDRLGGYDENVYYESESDTAQYRGETGTRSLVSKIVTADVTKIINMPVLKDHNQAGITACLKNLAFGSVNNTARFHKAPMYCSPAIADICALPALRDKTVLHILDGLRACYNSGPDASNPAYITKHQTVYLATDPVACDTIALEVIQKLRKDAGLPNLNETSGRPVHIAAAGQKGLGTADRAKIDLVELSI